MPGFLSNLEIKRMQADFNRLLDSPEATTATITITTVTGAYDPAFRIRETDAGQITAFTTEARCIQEIVKPKDKTILDWGIMEVGDCVFYFRKDLDLGNNQTDEDTPNQTISILVEDVEWVTIPARTKDFTRYLKTRLGNSQLGQVIPCRMKKSLRSITSDGEVLP